MNNKNVNEAIERFKQEGESGISWTFFHCMSFAEQMEFDNQLVAENHPLAHQPGTTESRFKKYVMEKAGKNE